MDNPTGAGNQRPTTEVVRDATESARELFASDERVMKNVEELQNRAERTVDWRGQFSRSPMLMMSAAFMGGLLLSRVFTGRD